MPSPFPGMDPYLENPATWPDLHHGLIAVIQEHLNRTIRPKYYARVEERVYLTDDDDPGKRFIIPDVRIMAADNGGKFRPAPPAVGGVATLEVAEPVVLTELVDEEIHEAYLKVFDAVTKEVVTVIEVLSPTNKCPGSYGRLAYQRKRTEILHSPTHLVEIDLLREGTTFIASENVPPHHYLVYLSRVEKRRKTIVWPILLRQRLPVIPIPLRGDDPDALLDLQAVLATAYERGANDAVIDYTRPPTPALPPELAEWGQTLAAHARRDT